MTERDERRDRQRRLTDRYERRDRQRRLIERLERLDRCGRRLEAALVARELAVALIADTECEPDGEPVTEGEADRAAADRAAADRDLVTI